jgi:hypothetical protein
MPVTLPYSQTLTGTNLYRSQLSAGGVTQWYPVTKQIVRSASNVAVGTFIGLYVGGNDLTTPVTVFSGANRFPAITKAYYDFASNAVPTTVQRGHANTNGAMIHICIATNANLGATYRPELPPPAHPSLPRKQAWTYNQIINGSCDAYFEWLAVQLQSINRKFTFDINHEPENQTNGVGRTEAFSDSTWYTNRANTTVTYRQRVLKEYADANRHVRAIFRRMGTTNCLWMNTFASLGSNGTDYNSWVYPALYPGDDVVDVCAWDPYDMGATRTPLSIFSQGYNLMKNGLLDSSPFYEGRGAKDKPFMLGEFGTNTIGGSDAYSTSWLASVPAALGALPQIKGATYWSSSYSSSTGFIIHTAGSPERAAFVSMVKQPHLTPMPS